MNTNTLIDLKPFCLTGPSRTALAKPFTRDGFTYATDGRMAVRVEARENEPGDEKALDAAKLFEPELAKPHTEHAWPVVPEPVTKICGKCDGRGKFSKCADCDGDGVQVCDLDHEHECERCGGSGQLPGNDSACITCNGTGHEDEVQTVRVAHTAFSDKYLRLALTLPDAKLHLADDPMAPALITFAGGVALLMPVRIK